MQMAIFHKLNNLNICNAVYFIKENIYGRWLLNMRGYGILGGTIWCEMIHHQLEDHLPQHLFRHCNVSVFINTIIFGSEFTSCRDNIRSYLASHSSLEVHETPFCSHTGGSLGKLSVLKLKKC